MAFCLLTMVRAEWWDDFSNNLATDLSPLLALFGEQVTKQYLSESTSILDNVIFAMAPLGIVTAMVSAIRVCGGPSLRAFIGRAQEGGGIAEAELCSSTSRDVCELYHNGAIVRVFGRPKILEVIHDRAANDFYYREEQEQLKSPRHGIYVPREYLGENSVKTSNWKERKTFQGIRGPLPRKKQIVGQDDIEARKQETVEFAPNPNLSFNIGITKRPLYVHLLAAGLGILAQASVIVFGGIATYFWQWEKNDAPPSVWAFPIMAVGTITLSCGMFFCAFLVERSTEERVFLKGCKDHNHAEGTKCTNKECQSTIYIVQPGNQSIGDQTYDSFAFSDASEPLTEYTTSWKQKNSAQSSEQLRVWLATGSTILGFAFQFVGLRAMHSSVSVVLLAAILVMSIVRSMLRTGRLKETKNLLRNHPDEVKGHELDWLAIEMTNGALHQKFNTLEFLVNGPLLWNGSDINFLINDGKDGTNPPARNSSSASEKIVDEKEDGRVLICAFKDSNADEQSHEQESEKKLRLCEANWLKTHNAVDSPLVPQPCTAQKLIYYRSRLAELTSQSAMNKSKGQADWGDRLVPLRRQVQQLKTAIESSTQILFANSSMKPRWRKARSLAFSLNIMVPSLDNTSNCRNLQQVHIFLRRSGANSGNQSATWEVDRNSLEAVLSLWNWSFISNHDLEKEDEAGLQISMVPGLAKARIIATGATRYEFESAQTDLKYWSDDLSPFTTTQKWTIEPGENPTSASTVWKKAHMHEETRLKPRSGNLESTKSLIRIFGWPGSRPSKQMFALAKVVELSIPVLCAQELYQVFLGAMVTTLDSICENTSVQFDAGGRIYLHNDVISGLMDSVVSSGLGSHQDAPFIVVPTLSRRSKLPLPTTVNVAQEGRVAGRFNEAERYLIWALRYSLHSNTDEEQESKLFNAALLELTELYRHAWQAMVAVSDDEWSPLHWAAASGKQDSITTLTTKEFVPLIDVVDKRGRTPLIVALLNFQEEAAKQLLEGGAAWNIDIDGLKAWEWAFSNGHWSCGKFLLGLVNQDSKAREWSTVTILRIPTEPCLPKEYMKLGQVLFDPNDLLGKLVAMCETTDEGTQRLATRSMPGILDSPYHYEIWVYKFGQRGIRDKYCLRVRGICSLKERLGCWLSCVNARVDFLRRMCWQLLQTRPEVGLSGRDLTDALHLLLDQGGHDSIVDYRILTAAANNDTLAESALPILLERDWKKIFLRPYNLRNIMQIRFPHGLRVLKRYLEEQAEDFDVGDDLLVAVLEYGQEIGNHKLDYFKLLLNHRKKTVSKNLLWEILGGLSTFEESFVTGHYEIDDYLDRHNKGEIFKIEGLDFPIRCHERGYRDKAAVLNTSIRNLIQT